MPAHIFVGIDPGVTTGFAVLRADPAVESAYKAVLPLGEHIERDILMPFHKEDAVSQEAPNLVGWERLAEDRYRTLNRYSSRYSEVTYRRDPNLKVDESERPADTRPYLWAEALKTASSAHEPAVAQAIADRLIRLREYEEFGPNDEDSSRIHFLCEKFTNNEKNASEPYLSPVRIRAGIEAILGEQMTSVTPSTSKTTWTDDRLKALGLYVPGPDHIRDAVRVAMVGFRAAQVHESGVGIAVM